MNKPNPTLIRQCMVEYANQLGRSHFEVCVVKRVVRSFATGVDDVLSLLSRRCLAIKTSAMHQTADANYLTSFVKIIHT